MSLPDFGVYHHSTRKQSEILRESVRDLFSHSFDIAGIRKGEDIRVLDAGCGSGFLCAVVASYFPNAQITGIDLFKSGSLRDLSLDAAIRNMERLGFSRRVEFVTADLTESLKSLGTFDLIVSNLVLHNLGQRRKKAFENIVEVMKHGAFFVYGDLSTSNEPEGSDSSHDVLGPLRLIYEQRLESMSQYRLQIFRNNIPNR